MSREIKKSIFNENTGDGILLIYMLEKRMQSPGQKLVYYKLWM